MDYPREHRHDRAARRFRRHEKVEALRGPYQSVDGRSPAPEPPIPGPGVSECRPQSVLRQYSRHLGSLQRVHVRVQQLPVRKNLPLSPQPGRSESLPRRKQPMAKAGLWLRHLRPGYSRLPFLVRRPAVGKPGRHHLLHSGSSQAEQIHGLYHVGPLVSVVQGTDARPETVLRQVQAGRPGSHCHDPGRGRFRATLLRLPGAESRMHQERLRPVVQLLFHKIQSSLLHESSGGRGLRSGRQCPVQLLRRVFGSGQETVWKDGILRLDSVPGNPAGPCGNPRHLRIHQLFEGWRSDDAAESHRRQGHRPGVPGRRLYGPGYG